jgi:subtilisin family serine protease
VIRATTVLAVGAVLAALLTAPSVAAPPSRSATGRYLVVARSAADVSGLRAKAIQEGARVVHTMPQLKALAIQGSDSVRRSLAADGRTLGVARDHVARVAVDRPQATPNLTTPGLRGGQRVALRSSAVAPSAGIRPDPAFSYRGLMWDYGRIGLPNGWRTTAGSPKVTVGVSDTGLDYTHAELAPKVERVIDFTQFEDPPLCKTEFGISDEELAAEFGGPADGDWYGHGSWIGGNIAAALDRRGVNGIAPRVGLVSLKIAQWCGFAYDSSLIASFVTAADLGIDIVNISFGGYLDRSDPEQELIYQAYIDAVRYARGKGTVIVASAGNESARIGAGGLVLSHGTGTAPGDELFDAFGLYEVPGGIPGVVDVSSTGNVVNPSSATCPPGTVGDPGDPDADPPVPPNFNATCKPASDRHQAAGAGRRNQLAYYSNYGPRIDLAGPGGARKFNLPNYDRGGTPGFPYTSEDLTNVWEDFNITSNFATQIPCFVFTSGSGFPQGECYTAIQGTSMAAPHVVGAFALSASAHPGLRKHPAALIAWVKARANRNVHNLTQVLSATDTSGGDLTGGSCPTGYCHLGGARISNRDAYGAGLVNVANP